MRWTEVSKEERQPCEMEALGVLLSEGLLKG